MASLLNIKDFGAVGDGSTDDTAAINRCFRHAFGNYYGPHGGYGDTPGPYANREVYFPAGDYRVSSDYSADILGVTKSACSSHGYYYPLIEVASTDGLRSTDMIYVRGSHPSVNGSYGIEVVDDTHFVLWMAQYVEDVGAGGTATKPCLQLHMVQGGHIFGAGRIATQITATSPNCAALSLNGWGYARMEALGISSAAGGIGLDYNWAQRDGDTVSSQSNTFRDLSIAGDDYGLTIGWGQAMCSETLWQNCYLSAPGGTGVLVKNYNALQQTFIGGNIAQCRDYGIHVASGAAPVIIGVGFQNYQHPGKADIYIENGVLDAYAIIGCRSESPNFFKSGPSMPYNLIACAQLGATPGFFYSGVGPANLIGCASEAGWVEGGGGTPLNPQGCKFQLPDWNRWYGPPIGTPRYVSLTANEQGMIVDGGVTFDNAGATGEVQYVLPVDQTELTPGVNAGRLPAGARIRFLVLAPHDLKIKASTDSTIRLLTASPTAKGGHIQSSTVGSYIELMATDDGGYHWVTTASTGVWT